MIVIEKSTGIVKAVGEIVETLPNGRIKVNNSIYSDLSKDNTLVLSEYPENIKPNYFKYLDGEYIQIKDIESEPIKISLDNLVAGLIGTALFRELNNYINVSPALKLFIGDGILTPDEIVKLKAQLELDRDDEILSVALYDYLIGKLGELENAV